MTTKLPAHRMAVSPDQTLLVLAISSHLQVFELPTCKLLSSTQNPDLNPSGSNHLGLLRLLLIHQDPSSNMVLISTGEDKLLKTWQLPSLKLINSRELIKRATSIAVSPNGQNILIADKFGDVYNLPFNAPSQTVFQSDPDQEAPAPAPEPSTKLDPKADPSKPVCKPILPIAGHVSLLTSLTFIPSPSSPLLITADRDEHIRISRYPHAWSIVSYLLGHRKFVAALLWLENPAQQDSGSAQDPQGRLLSAGGDEHIYVWDHAHNICTKKILVKGLADGMKVWPHKQTWFAKTRSNKRRRKTVAQINTKNADVDGSKDGPPQEDQSALDAAEPTPESPPLVHKTCVNKMVLTPPSERAGAGYLLATSVGSSTLAAIPLPSIFDPQTGCLESVQYLDLGRPILDIVCLSDRHVLLSLDSSFAPLSADQSAPSLFRILTLSPDKIEESSDPTGLDINSLNRLASIEVSAEMAMPSQDTLYAELVLFTKEDGSGIQSRGPEEAQQPPGADRGGRSGKKGEGRLLSQKRCEMVLAKSAVATAIS